MIDLAAAAATHLGGGGDVGIGYARVVLALLACLVIAAGAILLLRHRSGRPFALALPRAAATERRITVVETRRLSPHADICLVEHGARAWLLVVQPAGIHVLGEMPCV